MIDFHSPEFRRNPYPVYELLRSRSLLLHFPGANFWLLFDYENVRRALTDHTDFSSRAAPAGNEPLEWMIFTDLPRHT